VGNYYPDHLFHSARRLLRRIALNDGSRRGDRRSYGNFGRRDYSTLSQLLSFRLDKIKFDRSFVAPSMKKRRPGNRACHPRSRKRIWLEDYRRGNWHI
jgi:hypothetical protein